MWRNSQGVFMLMTSSLGKIRLIKCMAANPIDNVRSALEGYAVRSVYGWTDRTVTLHRIGGQDN